jgi:protein FAM50
MGDFGAHFRRPESGIHTVEGNVAGPRAAELTKKRQKEQEAFEDKKRKIEEAASHKTMNDKFATNTTQSASDQQFQASTVGLVTAEEFKHFTRLKQGEQEKEEEEEKRQSEEEIAKQAKAAKKAKKKRLQAKKKMMSTLSFATDEDLLEDEDIPKKSLKDPTIDTSFLPDKQREEEALRERKLLEKEWKEQQETVKKEKLEIVYSYWDGSGHRRTVECFKGDTIGDFLENVRQDLAKEFRELTAISADALVYVKEDLMIPQDLTFYDLIVTKARGKSGPLFHFDVHDDIRVGPLDSRIEKDESHPGKVVERRWYDRNKHIFPASRWELFDSTKTYGSYSIRGGEVNKKKT